MAQTDPTKTGDFNAQFLPPHMAAPIFEEAARVSVAQRLFRQIPLSINGEAIPVVASKPTADWVAQGAKKPTTEGGLDLLNMQPKKIAAISVVSSEVVRANPGNYMNLLRPQIAEAFALAFDAEVFYGAQSQFNACLNDTTKAVVLDDATAYPQDEGGVHKAIVAGLQALVTDGKKLNGFALDEVVEPVLLAATDNTGRPLYIETPLADTSAAAARPGRLINRPSYMTEGIAEAAPAPGASDQQYTVAFGGDFTKGAWGVVGGISFDVSTQATVTLGAPGSETLVSLWEQNLVAIRAEAEFGFVLADDEAFVKYQLTVPATGA